MNQGVTQYNPKKRVSTQRNPAQQGVLNTVQGGGSLAKGQTPAQSLLKKQVASQYNTGGIQGGGRPSVGTGSNVQSGGFYSPALDKLKHSYLSQDYSKMPGFYGNAQDIMGKLSKDISQPTGLSDRDRQGIYNLARRQQQGAVKTAMQSMQDKLGTAGWKVGDSGIADSIMAKMAMQGSEQLGQSAQQIALNERDRRFQEALGLGNLNLSRNLGAGSIGNLLSNTYLGQQGLGLNALQTAGGLEQFQKQLQQQQSQFGATQGLANKKFQYAQEMDALNMLMGLAGYGQQNQQAQFQPYWSALAGLS